MQLPLPNLDTRRWQDLVEEGRALIPVYAPDWTDHNASDPGITLMELLAFLTEQLIYRVNQIPERHRRKFLALTGFTPMPPRPASGVLALALQPGQNAVALPAGLTFAARLPLQQTAPAVLFRTRRQMRVAPAAIAAVQVFDGRGFRDLTATWRDGGTLAVWGENPTPAAREQDQPALYVGFDQSLPVDESASLWLEFDNSGGSQKDRERLAAETADAVARCAPRTPAWPCPRDRPDMHVAATSSLASLRSSPPPHHAVRTAWEYHDGTGWQPLEPLAGAIVDQSRSLTLSGLVRVKAPSAMASKAVGDLSTPRYYLRCRMVSGRPDAAPRLKALFINAVEIEQTHCARHSFPVRAGTVPPAGQEPQVGRSGSIDLALDASGVVTSIALGGSASGPEVLVEDYRAPTPADPGQLVINLVPLGVATGYPLQEYRLTEFPVSGGSLRLWTLEDGAWQPWDQVPDFDSSDQDAHAYGLDPTQGIVRFGDGQRGRVPLPGVPILAAYEVTEAAAGNLPAAAVWQLAGADDSLNRALLGAEFPAAMNGLRPAANPLSVSGGADEEDVSHAAGRAAAGLYAHERLVELSDELGSDSLDQVRPDRTLALQAPQRAATLLDYDRLALDVPGTRVARARSWAGMDPTHPCLQAPGTVSVVILPELPVGRPAPTPGLLQTVQRYLGRRKLLGTRLVVCGPSYREVTVEASIQGVPGSDAGQLQARVAQTLNAFLDPLTGGPDGLGWPFGRDVYRSEILQVIGAVPGVDHVIRLTLKTDQGEPQCDNLCVGPMGLVTAGPHIILVE